MGIQEYVPLAPLTTFKIGGAARYFTEVSDVDEIREALAWARGRGLRHHLIAGGSNLLIPDQGLDALVIRIIAPHMNTAASGIIYDTRGSTVSAGAGHDLLQLIRASVTAGMTGWEKLSGIPGTLGGAIRGNAGAFGIEMKDVLAGCEALNTATGEVRKFTNAECEFSYRNSFFKQHSEWVILRASSVLEPGSPQKGERLIAETVAERERRHLQNVRAAGSFFMNPVASREVQEQFEKERRAQARDGRVPAGWLIEKAGMKGARVGGAIASEQHPNYLVNHDGATARDVRALARKIKETVKNCFGIVLTEEVSILG